MRHRLILPIPNALRRTSLLLLSLVLALDDDNDGLVNRADADDDNDGVPDKREAKTHR